MKKFLTCFLALSVAACGQVTNKQDSTAFNGWKILDQSNYSISYPPTWELNQSGEIGTSFILFAPLESPQANFRSNINLVIQDLTGKDINLDKYTEISVGQVKTMITNSNLIESKRVKTGAGEYQHVIYTGDQGVFHLKYEQYYWVVNEKAYILTLTTELANYDGLKETGEKVLGSFMLKK
ncbi:MAG: hypothetical protein ACLQQ4_00040 [Bacteroidia bacterium]